MILEKFPTQDQFGNLLQDATVVPVGVKILADTETPVSLLSRFERSCQHLFLLESAEGGERWGRYSFMGVSARAVIMVYRDDVVIREGILEKRIAHHGDPLSVLRTIMQPYKVAQLPGLPRFCGGLVGYLCYEMASFFEPGVKNRLPAEIPLAEFVIPDQLLIFDNISHSLSIVALAFKGDNPAEQLYADAMESVRELLELINAPAPEPTKVKQVQVEPLRPVQAPEYYTGMVNRVKTAIDEGEVIQCVVSQSFSGAAPFDLVRLYRTQRYVNPSPYLYFIKAGSCTLIGSSPETMIRLDNGVACLRPIAGTRNRGSTEQEDRKLADGLLQDEKERAEHLMLVDSGRSELGRVALPGTVQVSDLMVVERYSHVMHLVSNITADLDNSHDAFDLLRAAFPAGTLSGAPKVRAMQLIAELEESPRGPYGGAVGYISFDGNMDFAICIRTAVVEHGRMTVRSGAGIVSDSDPEKEYQESLNKAAAMNRALEVLHSATVESTNFA